MATFETALREQIDKRPKLGLKGRRIKAVLEMRPSRRRTRILARWEQVASAAVHANVEVGSAKAVAAIDWSAVDWKALFNTILELLLKLLPLFV